MSLFETYNLMTHTHSKSAGTERAVVAGLQLSQHDPAIFEEDMQEMALLCTTAGAQVVHRVVQRRDRPVSGTYFGQGKVEEIASLMKQDECSTLVVDAELTPAQVRSIEKIVEAKVIDRSQLILDIFALHAQTNEARIQVQLAQMRTLYPRLTHAWTHFSQQVGGIGTRGPGETQLEVDRRLVQRTISDLRRRLDKIEKSRRTQRKSRGSEFNCVLAGYTNVGKSSLLNRLSGAGVHVANKLFATLDTASRRMYLPGAGTIVLSDTVGFLRKLPHHLVASFRSTLEVARESNLILIVLDASSAWCEQQYTTVESVLNELGAGETPRLIIYNKTDCLYEPFIRKKLELAHPGALFVSAATGEGVDALRELLGQCVAGYKDGTMPDLFPIAVARPDERDILP